MSQTQPEVYFALPALGTGAPVLVLHAWWGLNDTIRALCVRLAEAGFVAFAPDLFEGKVAKTIAQAEALASSFDAKQEQVMARIQASVQFLLARTGASHVAVIGFSFGAYYGLNLAVAMPDEVKSLVVFYGTGISDFSGAKAEVLGHFAEHDEFEPLDNVEALEELIQQAGRPVTFYHYPGTGHWFFEPDVVDAYDEDAANLAWERTLSFLRQATDL